MRKDDSSHYETGAFISLLVVTSLLLVFCGLRLWKIFEARKPYRPLQAFYVILGVFLLCKRHAGRFFYFLSPFAEYPTMVYFALDIAPVALINCITGIVCYICIAFLPSLSDNVEQQKKESRDNFILTVSLISTSLATFWLTFIFLYLFSTFYTDMYSPPSVTRVEDILFCLVTALFLQKRGHDVYYLIVDVMKMKPPLRVCPRQLLIVRRISVFFLLLRAGINIVLFILGVGKIAVEGNSLGFGVFVFCFYFTVEDLPLIVLMTLVYVQENEKARVRRETMVHCTSISTALNPTDTSSATEEILI